MKYSLRLRTFCPDGSRNSDVYIGIGIGSRKNGIFFCFIAFVYMGAILDIGAGLSLCEAHARKLLQTSAKTSGNGRAG